MAHDPYAEEMPHFLDLGSHSQRFAILWKHHEETQKKIEWLEEQLAAMSALLDARRGEAATDGGQEAAIAAETPHQRIQRRFPYFADSSKVAVFEQHLTTLGNPSDAEIIKFFKQWDVTRPYSKEQLRHKFGLNEAQQKAWQALGRAKGYIKYIEKKGYQIVQKKKVDTVVPNSEA